MVLIQLRWFFYCLVLKKVDRTAIANYALRLFSKRKYVVTDSIGPLNRRGRAVTFEAPKVTKMAVSRNASLRTRPLPCKTRKTWAGIILPRHA